MKTTDEAERDRSWHRSLQKHLPKIGKSSALISLHLYKVCEIENPLNTARIAQSAKNKELISDAI